MVDYNYHTHTYRCGHATGTEKEYLENAISRGLKVFGFSDHIFVDKKDIEKTEELNEYITTINKLKSEYKDKVEIHVGLEVEFFPSRLDYLKSLKSKGLEYLILGQHFVENEKGERKFIFENLNDSKNVCEKYYILVKKALETGLFSCLAHPDLFVRQFTELDETFDYYSRKICEVAKENNVPLEINLNGRYKVQNGSKKQPYPNERFWKIAGEVGNDVIVGIDAHCSEIILDGDFAYAEELIKK